MHMIAERIDTTRAREGRLDFRKIVRDLARRQRLLLERISRVEELADAMLCELADIERQLDGRSDTAADDSVMRGSRRMLQQGAEPSALWLDVRTRSDGSASVRIDGGKAFTLPPILACLLEILATDAGPSGDEFVAWKPLDTIAERLRTKVGRSFGRHAVTQHVYRLRRLLYTEGGASPFLVQTNRRLGVRFAVKRQGRAAGREGVP
jgi:hypothetical protein